MSLTFTSKEDSQLIRLRSHTAAARKWWRHVAAIKESIENDDLYYCAYLWTEIVVTDGDGNVNTEETQRLHITLYSMSTTDGGIWTTHERAQIRKAWGLK